MGKTSIYQIDYFDPYMSTRTDLLMDQRRFQTIENQLYAQYQIFGNGVIDDDPTNPSWRITTNPNDSSGGTVLITAGHGHVAWMAAQTTQATVLSIPTPPGVLSPTNPVMFWIYATQNSTTPDQQTVTFIASLVEITDIDYYIGLGAVQVSQTNDSPPKTIVTPYNDAVHGRNNISLFASLANIINNHLHIGGANNPSPIDLSLHVQGLLSGAYIKDLDASAVTQGTFNADRLPVISHSILSRIGTLTHPEIDSLLAAQVVPTGLRLSDIALSDLLLLVLALKRQPNLSNVDATLLDTLFYVPGITPNQYVAYYADFAFPSNPDQPALPGVIWDDVPTSVPLAIIDTVNREIIGQNGQSVNTTMRNWFTEQDFTTEYANNWGSLDSHIAITPSGFSLDQPLNYTSVVPTSQLQTTWNAYITITDTSTYAAIPPPPSTTPTSYDNEFKDGYSLNRILYTTFGTAQDWTQAQKIAIGWGLNHNTFDSNPGTISVAAIVSSGGTPIAIGSSTIYLSAAQVISTTTPDILAQPSRYFTVLDIEPFFASLSSAQRASVSGFAFYWNTTTGWDGKEVDFYLLSPQDYEITNSSNITNAAQVVAYRQASDESSPIFIWNEQLYAALGTFVFRTNTNYSDTYFNSVVVTYSDPNNNNNANCVSVQTRAAIPSDSSAPSVNSALANATKYYLNTDHSVNSACNTGEWFDIIVSLTPYIDDISNLPASPIVSSISLSFSNLAYPSTYEWLPTTTGESQQPFYQALTLTNIDPNGSDGLVLADTTAVGEFEFVRNSNLWSSYVLDDSAENGGTNFYNGGALYPTPMQVWNSTAGGYSGIRDRVMLPNGHMVVADTSNDRVVEVDANGELVRAIQGNLRMRMTALQFVLTNVIWNSRTGILYLAFTQNVQVGTLSSITLMNGSNVLNFGSPPGTSKINVAPFGALNGNSATLQVTFSSDLTQMINNWGSGTQLVLTSGAFVSANSSTDGTNVTTLTGTTSGTTSGGTSGTCNGKNPSDYIISVSELLNQTTLYNGSYLAAGTFTCLPGLPNDTIANVSTQEYRGATYNSSVLYGPNDSVHSNNITINVYNGDVTFDNIFSPVSVQVDNFGNWIVANAGNSAVTCYSTTSAIAWSIPSSASFYYQDGLGGSAYLLNNRTVATVIPGSTSGTGNAYGIFSLIDITNNNALRAQVVLDGDGVYVLPTSSQNLFWVVIDDRINDGLNSHVAQMDNTGKIYRNWAGTIGRLIHPTGFSLISDTQFVVSE